MRTEGVELAPGLTVDGPSLEANGSVAMPLEAAQVEAGDYRLPYRMNEHEVLLGFVLGKRSPPRRPSPPVGVSPREALEEILAEALGAQPCIITFSGGRDSSALLAVALKVARSRGLPEPTAFTLRFPGIADAEETSWQQLVVDHLKPRTWDVVEVDPSSAEFLGPVGTASLSTHGLLWPPALHLDTGWLGRARGATVITGEGGDEILGPRRATTLRTLLGAIRHQSSQLGPSLLREAAKEVAPARVRAAGAERRLSTLGYLNWLRDPWRTQALHDIAEFTTSERWSWAEAVRSHPRCTALLLGLRNRDWLAATFGARFVHPFLRSNFVDAIARHGGSLGYAGRTAAMRELFGDLLPDAVLSRSTKAAFNTTFHGPATRAFAQRWNGAGVDPAVVDVEVLRSSWLAERVHPGTTALLQTAWLASVRAPDPPPAGPGPHQLL